MSQVLLAGVPSVSACSDVRRGPSISAFWSNVLANLIGTFVGAGLALLTNRMVMRNAARERELRLLQSIVDRLSRSRALTRPCDFPRRTSSLTDFEVVDRDRCTLSVLGSRDRVARVIDELSSDSQALGPLNEMHAAFLDYLNHVEQHPEDYERALGLLGQRLSQEEQALARVYPDLALRAPGELAARTAP